MFQSIIHIVQVKQATRKLVKYLTAEELLAPTEEEYATAVFFAVKDIRMTVRERRYLVETLTELKDQVLKESVKKIKP